MVQSQLSPLNWGSGWNDSTAVQWDEGGLMGFVWLDLIWQGFHLGNHHNITEQSGVGGSGSCSLGVFEWVVFLASGYFVEVSTHRSKDLSMVKCCQVHSGLRQCLQRWPLQVLAYRVPHTFTSELQPRCRKQQSLWKRGHWLHACTRVEWPHHFTKLGRDRYCQTLDGNSASRLVIDQHMDANFYSKL